MKAEIQSTNEQALNVEGALLFDKTAEKLENLEDFVRGMDNFRLSEAAIATVSAMRGKVYHQHQDEVGKSNPDEAKIRELKAQLAQLATERDLVYSGDQDTKRLVISKYAPTLQAAIQAKKELLDQEAALEQSHGR